jgi:predicted cobalt transporter CbtA
MAASKPPTSEIPSRRHRKAAPEPPEPPALPAIPASRSARNRQRREESLERQFHWIFIVVVTATTLYLLSRTSWGIRLLTGHF